MICAAGLLDQTVTTTTVPGSPVSVPTTLAPASTTTLAGQTTTTAPAGTATSTTTVAKAAPHVVSTTTTVAHGAAATTTTVAKAAAASGAVNNDRGVVHQLFLDAGASKAGAHTAQIYLAAPLRAMIILVVALILSRLVSRLSHRMVNGMRLVSPLVQATPRGAARVQTLAGAFTSVFRAVIWIIAILEVLNDFSINLTPFIAGATVIGAALGFGAQSLVKDFLSGVLILAEDQYGVGDHIAIGTGATITSGTVESVNLRVTRLRGADGGILYVPNGDIRTLSNDTETDSQALVDVVVPYGTDLVAAAVAAQEAAREMADDPEWSPDFAGEPYFAGVQDATSGNGLVLRLIVLTRPGQHLRLSREMRLRVLERLRRDRIAWAPPDAQPAEVPAEAQVRKARVDKRQAERETAEKVAGAASSRGIRRRSRRASAARAVARRVAARRRVAETGAPVTGAADTAAADTEPADTAAADRGPADRGPADTGPADTEPADTGAADTAAAETGQAGAGTAGAGTEPGSPRARAGHPSVAEQPGDAGPTGGTTEN